MKHQTLNVSLNDAGNRLDKFISDSIPELTRTMVQLLIKDGNVFVNEEEEKAGYKLKELDEIQIMIPDLKEPLAKAEAIPLEVIYEDSDLIVVNKPQGMVTHPASGIYSGTLVNALLFHCKNSLSGINGIQRPGIVHRLDKETSGLIIACKNDKAHASIADQIKERTVKRSYYALVHGVPKNDLGTIDKPIGRHKTYRHKMAVVDDGRKAITHYQVIQKFENYSFIECNLETGRTHQIRVHMASLQHPVLGDEIYGRKNDKTNKMMLHAFRLVFTHPSTKKEIKLEIGIPDRFKGFL